MEIDPNVAKIRPVNFRLLIEPEKPKDTSKGGILLPEVARSSPPKGRVLATDSKRGASPYPVGSVVYFVPYAGFPVTVTMEDGTETTYLLIKEDDVVAVER